ncbi:MAG: sel1 repeat family protein [Akkermansia sp.]|nr:sel1 repeat family protein [Akkermansia sp.]
MNEELSPSPRSEKKGGSMRPLLLGLGAALVVGGTVGGLFYFGVLGMTPQEKHAEAMVLLQTGDTAQALPLLRESAEKAYAPAYLELGRCAAEGIGMAQDAAVALTHYQAAAGLGYAPAQSLLAACYEAGTGAPADSAEAARWYRAAAEQGDMESQYKTALHCTTENRVEEAAGWYLAAADQGHAAAAAALAACYAMVPEWSRMPPKR